MDLKEALEKKILLSIYVIRDVLIEKGLINDYDDFKIRLNKELDKLDLSDKEKEFIREII